MSVTSTYPQYINLDLMKRIIEHNFQCKKTQIQELFIKPMSCGSGENYCSDIYEVKVKYRLNGLESREEDLIVKSIANQKLTTLKDLDIFGREKYFYKNIMPQIEYLMGSLEKQWLLGPKFWYATSNPIDTLVMENLVSLDFELKSRQEGFDIEHSIMVLHKLAEYHALTYVLAEDKDKFSALKDRYAFGLVNKKSCKSQAFQALFKTQLESFIEILHEDKDFKDISVKLQDYCNNFEERVTQCIYPLHGEINVLNHGDVWVNNLLFRHTPEAKHPLEVRFIDFQLSFFGSLGYDVNYFLNTSVQLSTLRDHRPILIDAYVQSFLKIIKRFPNIEHQPTVEQIHHEIDSREPYGFFVAYAFLPLMAMNPNDSQDNSLDTLNDPQFAKKKISLMFGSNSRTLTFLKYSVKRLFEQGIL